MPNSIDNLSWTCPTARTPADNVLLAHGEGGRLMRKLLRERILPILGVASQEDAAAVNFVRGDCDENRLAITTDSFVVSPLFFPGGDIGCLAVYGTLNDLAVAGAQPLCLTLSLIIEEGFSLELLERILTSAAVAAKATNTPIVAGDTKVVPRGAADGLFINTSAVGRYRAATLLSSHSIQVGDILIASGPIAKHGIAVLAARENLQLQPAPHSDCASLVDACRSIQLALGSDLHAMRDATRGGVSAVMHEWAEACGATLQLVESQLPVADETRGACELLGLDPLVVANEGTFVAAVAPQAAERALEALRQCPVSAAAQVIGRVIEPLAFPVVIERLFSKLQPLDEPSGAQLPRIC